MQIRVDFIQWSINFLIIKLVLCKEFAGSGIKNENISSKVILFLLCVIDISSKCTSVIPLKGKKGIAVNNDFQNILDEINCKQNKI